MSSTVIKLSRWAARQDATLKLALLAESLLRPGSGWQGRRKLDPAEAVACARLVTELIRRHGLQPTTVLQRDGRATGPGATYPFFLSEREMGDPASVDPEKRRVSRAFDAHLQSLRLIRDAAGEGMDLDEAICLLAERVPRFLSQFEDGLAQEPCEALARDLQRVAAWLDRPARGIDLAAYLADATRNDLAWDDRTGTFSHLPGGPDFLLNLWPELHLTVRPVGRATGALLIDRRVPREGVIDLNGPDLHPIGTARFLMGERVSLQIIRGEGRPGLRAVFALQPVTIASGEATGEERAGFRFSDLLRERMTLRGDHFPLGEGDRQLYLRANEVRIEDPAYAEVYARVAGEDPIYGPHRGRTVEITPETVADLFGDDPFPCPSMTVPAALLPHLSEIPGVGARAVPLDQESERQALARALYEPGPRGVPDLLLARATRRVRAWEAHVQRQREGDLARRLAFRARMRAE